MCRCNFLLNCAPKRHCAAQSHQHTYTYTITGNKKQVQADSTKCWIFSLELFFCLPIYISLTLNLQYVLVPNTYDLRRATLKRTQYWISSCRSFEETKKQRQCALFDKKCWTEWKVTSICSLYYVVKPENDARCYGTKALQYYIVNQSDSNGVLCYNWLKCSKYSVY